MSQKRGGGEGGRGEGLANGRKGCGLEADVASVDCRDRCLSVVRRTDRLERGQLLGDEQEILQKHTPAAPTIRRPPPIAKRRYGDRQVQSVNRSAPIANFCDEIGVLLWRRRVPRSHSHVSDQNCRTPFVLISHLEFVVQCGKGKKKKRD